MHVASVPVQGMSGKLLSLWALASFGVWPTTDVDHPVHPKVDPLRSSGHVRAGHRKLLHLQLGS